MGEIKTGWYEYNGEHFFVQYLHGILCYWTIESGWSKLDSERESNMVWSSKQYGE